MMGGAVIGTIIGHGPQHEVEVRLGLGLGEGVGGCVKLVQDRPLCVIRGLDTEDKSEIFTI